MERITKYMFIILAISFAFGSFNPLYLQGAGDISGQEVEQKGFTPILFGLCMLFSFCDKGVRNRFSSIRKFYYPLICLLITYILSSLIYDSASAANFSMYFFKLFIAFTGFSCFSLFFIQHPESYKLTIRVFACTCCLIMIMFFTRQFEGYYYYSKGRLVLFGENPNSYSFVMGVSVLIIFRELFNNWSKLIKLVLVCFALLIMFYILMSGSRGTVLILGLALIIYNIDYFKKHILFSSIIIGLCVFILMYLYNSSSEEISIFERFYSLSKGDEREGLISNALELFYSNPLLGYGINGYYDMKLNVFHDIRDSHNMIVSIMVTSGILGLTSILFFFSRVFNGCKTVWNTDRFPLVLFVYMFLISMKTGEILSYSMMWFVYAIIIANIHFSNLKSNSN